MDAESGHLLDPVVSHADAFDDALGRERHAGRLRRPRRFPPHDSRCRRGGAPRDTSERHGGRPGNASGNSMTAAIAAWTASMNSSPKPGSCSSYRSRAASTSARAAARNQTRVTQIESGAAAWRHPKRRPSRRPGPVRRDGDQAPRAGAVSGAPTLATTAGFPKVTDELETLFGSELVDVDRRGAHGPTLRSSSDRDQNRVLPWLALWRMTCAPLAIPEYDNAVARQVDGLVGRARSCRVTSPVTLASAQPCPWRWRRARPRPCSQARPGRAAAPSTLLRATQGTAE